MARVKIPWMIGIELTQNCPRRCVFCGVHIFPKGTYEFMTVDTARAIASDIARWNQAPRLELALRGEPTLNPNYLCIIQILRLANPKACIQLTTNGSIISKGDMRANLAKMYKAGLNIVLLDTYEPERDRLRKQVAETGIPYYELEKGSFHPWSYHPPKTKALVLIDDIRLKKDTDHRKYMTNFAGAVDIEAVRATGVEWDVPDVPIERSCTRPFRELIVHWDGEVALCCEDFRRMVSFGNVNEKSLIAIWNGPKMLAAKELLARKDRRWEPCVRCIYHGGYRQGFGRWNPFPDKSRSELIEMLGVK